MMTKKCSLACLLVLFSSFGCTNEADSANAAADGSGGGASPGEQIEVTDARDLYRVYDEATLLANWQEDWPDYPGDPSRLMNVKWAKDGVETDDPDYDKVNKETYYPAGSEEVEMGVFARTRFPVVLKRLDFDLVYPSDLLELSDVVRHNKALDDKPGVVTNVEFVAPGRVKFTFDLEGSVQLFAPWDRALATMNFKVLKPGSGTIRMHRPEGESWEFRNEESDRLVAPFPEKSTNWVTLADGSGAPYIFDIYNLIVIRE